jgi:anthranilate phosphoribosyltransferase
MPLDQLVRTATERPLTEQEAADAFGQVMEGDASPVQIAALLVAIRTRGAEPEEVAGGVRALRRAMVSVPVADPDSVVDTCGTGGGSITTFNISTAAALLAAACGARVAKHGNRSFTSRCGSADVLEALGVRIELNPEQEAEVLERAGIVFMFAPLHHPAMRHVGPVRRELGMPTIMNLLGPLTNPAGARRQVIGVADPHLLPLIADSLRVLEHRRALVVHGAPGMDELSPLGSTRVLEVGEEGVSEWTFDPQRDLGWPSFAAEELAGGDAAENAEVVTAVLRGTRQGAARAAVVLNAAAALYVAGRVDSLRSGVERAERALDAGAGWERLETLREASQGV